MSYTSRIPNPLSTATVKPGSEYTPYNYGYMACDPAKSLTGSVNYNGWRAWSLGSIKFNIDCGAGCVPKRIYFENYHDSGTGTGEGVRNVLVYGTNSATAFANTTYATTTDLTLLATLEIPQHVASNVADPHIYMLNNGAKAVYRYIVLRIADNWGSGVGIGLRRVEVQVGGVISGLVQSWGLKMGADLVQSYADAPVLQGVLSQPWGDAGLLVTPMVQRWRDMSVIVAPLNQPWHAPALVETTLVQQWGTTSSAVFNSLGNAWDLLEKNKLLSSLNQVWWTDIETAATAQSSINSPVYSDPPAGGPINVPGILLGSLSSITGVSVEASLDQYVISASLQLSSQTEFLLCEPGTMIALSGVVSGVDLVLRIDSRSRNRSGAAVDSYSVELLSPAAWLDAPYAEPIDGEFSGLASAIANQVVQGSLPISWEVVDWYIGPDIFIVENQTPLNIIRSLAAAVGGVVQSAPNGSLRIISRYSSSVADWNNISGMLIEEATSVTSSVDTFEYQPGYNQYRISSDEGASEVSDIRVTVEDEAGHVKLVKAQVPNLATLTLTHSGGGWVIVEPEGRRITTVEEPEIVEIVQGEGRTSNTIYNIVGSSWKHTDLGAVGFEPSGLITAGVNGESLLELNYSFEEQVWRVSSPEIEKVQFILELTNG